VGLSFVKFGKLLGLRWIGVMDPLPNKCAQALKMGADAVFGKEDLLRLEKELAKSLEAVVDAVGHEALVNRCARLSTDL
jgi:threonine dehydrogenase-like Zn-dependent dehydrogenase